MELADTGKVIGNISRIPRDFGAVEAGFIVNDHFRRKGYALEALAAVVESAFAEGAHRVYAECDPRNVPSRMLLEKAGFRREARFRQNIWFRRDEAGEPVWKDTFVYAMLESDLPLH